MNVRTSTINSKRLLISIVFQLLAVLGIAFREKALVMLSIFPVALWLLGILCINPIVSVWLSAFANVTNISFGEVWGFFIAVLLMIPCFLIPKLLKGERSIYVDTFDIFFVLFGALIVLTIPKWHSLKAGIVGSVFIYVAPYFQVLIFREYLTKKNFVNSLLIFLFISTIFGLQVLKALLQIIASGGIHWRILHKYGIGWAYSNYIAAFGNLLLPLNLALLMVVRKHSIRIWAFFNIALLILAIITTISRGGFLTLIAGTMAFGIGLSIAKGKIRYFWGTVLLFALMAILIFTTLLGKFLLYRFIVAAYDPSVLNRYKMWAQSIEYIKKSPLIGAGPYQKLVFSGIIWTTNPHNFYLKLGMDVGIPGVVLYVLIIGYLLLQSLKLVKRGTMPAKILGVAFLSTVALAAFNAAVEPTFSGYHYNTMFWYIMGLLLALSRKDKKLWEDLEF